MIAYYERRIDDVERVQEGAIVLDLERCYDVAKAIADDLDRRMFATVSTLEVLVRVTRNIKL